MDRKKTKGLDAPPRRDYDPSLLENARRSQGSVFLDFSFVKFTNAQLLDLCLALGMPDPTRFNNC